jgi:hypothetical protein
MYTVSVLLLFFSINISTLECLVQISSKWTHCRLSNNKNVAIKKHDRIIITQRNLFNQVPSTLIAVGDFAAEIEGKFYYFYCLFLLI